ncbi:MAG: YihY/virulence factor BrkB family protein [Pseudomonadota bacterium]
MIFGKEFAAVLSCTLRNWIADNASTTGAALAFYCAFSLAPLLVIILALAGWIVGEVAAFGFLQSQLTLLFGSSTAKVVLEAMRQSHQTQGVLAAALSVGTLVIGATTVLAALDQALEHILVGKPRHSSGIHTWVRRRILSLGFILAVSFLLLVSLAVSTVIGGMRSWATERFSAFLTLVSALDLVLSIGLMTGLFALIYQYVPAQRLPWKLVFSGGLLTAILFSVGKWTVGLYLATSTVPNAFGAAASFAALLLWLYYTAQIFLVGAEFTACLAGLRDGKSGEGQHSRSGYGKAQQRGVLHDHFEN